MFYALGLCVAIIAVAKLAQVVWKRLHRKEFEWTTGNGRYWAVVTGSTDGIGFEFARQLAQKGYNLMLISRNPDKLAVSRNKILAECASIEIRTLPVDFKRTDIYEKINSFLDLQHNDIYILVNNVGFGSARLAHFVDESPQFHQDLINVNLLSTVRMTELVLPSMKAKGRGLILNVSSFLALHTGPSITAYGATKAFVSYLTRALYEECTRYNVLVFLLEPGSVSTNLLKLPPSILTPSSKCFVTSAMKSINWTTPESLGYLPHSIGHRMFQMMEHIIGPHNTARFLEAMSTRTVNQQHPQDKTQ